MDQKRILVIEDDPDGQEVVGRLLKFHRINYLATSSAEEALDALKTESFALGIVDLSLPGMDGFSFLGQLQRLPGATQMACIAITAYHSAEVAQKAIEAGFTAYFSKPLDSTSFVREVERIMKA